MNIVIRADASAILGTGHVMRCLVLAEALRARGANVVFVCRELAGNQNACIEGKGYPVFRLALGEEAAWQADLEQTRMALVQWGETVESLVVDHYGLDAGWESALRASCRNILVVDDLVGRPHDCDLLLDQNFYLHQDDTQARQIPSRARILRGPRHALLRPEFARLRKEVPARDGRVRRVLVCFGGADPHNHTAAALRALRPHAANLERIDVVAGPANRHHEVIATLCRKVPNALFSCAPSDMARRLAQADLAIGAGGTMNWERACLGVPALAFGIAANQQRGLEALMEAGYVLGVADMPLPDENRMASWLDAVLGNPALLRGVARRSMNLVDGLGAERVADALLPGVLTFRRAALEDAAAIFQWRNHPDIRAASLDDREISREAHQTWFEQTLSNPRRLLLVAERSGEAVGVVRFDFQGQDEALISVYRVPGRGGGRDGLIRHATQWLACHHPEIRQIRAQVLSENATSLAAFRSAGYRDWQHVFIKRLAAT